MKQIPMMLFVANGD